MSVQTQVVLQDIKTPFQDVHLSVKIYWILIAILRNSTTVIILVLSFDFFLNETGKGNKMIMLVLCIKKRMRLFNQLQVNRISISRSKKKNHFYRKKILKSISGKLASFPITLHQKVKILLCVKLIILFDEFFGHCLDYFQYFWHKRNYYFPPKNQIICMSWVLCMFTINNLWFKF